MLPLALVGLAYLLGRTDEFHLVPLAAVLPVLLAGVVGAGVPTLCGIPLGHVSDQWSVPLGMEAELDADAKRLSVAA